MFSVRGAYPNAFFVSEDPVRSFDSLTEREILALAIALEEEDEKIYADFAEGLKETFPSSAAVM